jgi:hypothetical protein
MFGLALHNSLRFAKERVVITVVEILGRRECLERTDAARQLTIDRAGQRGGRVVQSAFDRLLLGLTKFDS